MDNLLRQGSKIIISTDLGFVPVASGERYFISYKTDDAEWVGEIRGCPFGTYRETDENRFIAFPLFHEFVP